MKLSEKTNTQQCHIAGRIKITGQSHCATLSLSVSQKKGIRRSHIMQTGWSDHSSSHATPGSITVTERAEVHTKMILILSEVIRKYEHNASQCVIIQSIMVTCAGRQLYNEELKVCITFLDNEK